MPETRYGLLVPGARGRGVPGPDAQLIQGIAAVVVRDVPYIARLSRESQLFILEGVVVRPFALEREQLLTIGDPYQFTAAERGVICGHGSGLKRVQT
jgi:hypothetical protein